MKKKLSSLIVETSNETILISQSRIGDDEDEMVTISVETADTLIEWITQARDEILKTRDQS